MKQVRWPNGRVSELNDKIAERIAFKGGCMIVAAVLAPTQKQKDEAVTVEAVEVKKAPRKRRK